MSGALTKIYAYLTGIFTSVVPNIATGLATFIASKIVDPIADKLIADATAGFPNHPDLSPHAPEILLIEKEIRDYLDKQIPLEMAKLFPTTVPPTPPVAP